MIKLLSLLAIIIATVSQEHVYSKSSGDQYTRSTFMLPYLYATSSVSVILNLYGSNRGYSLELWQPLVYPPNSPKQRIDLSGSRDFSFDPLPYSGSWRIVVSPQSQEEQFLFSITLSANNQTIGRYADISRRYKLFPIYHKIAGTYNVTLTLPSNMVGQGSLALLGPYSEFTTSGKPSFTSESQATTVSLQYQTSGREYFMLRVYQSDYLTQTAGLITVRYNTDQYKCPISPGQFLDYNGAFIGCNDVLPTDGFPCKTYDNSVEICLQCFQSWVVSENGVCIKDTFCPSGQYFDRGNCYDAISKCQNFDKIGGYCRSCKDGHILQNYNNGTQACLANVRCSSNQYLLGQVCMNYVDNCASFQSSTGTCQICKQGYNFNANTCVKIVSPDYNCQLGFKTTSTGCVSIDQNCIFFNPDNTCMVCIKGYRLTAKGLCQKIICGVRQYSYTGYCVDASPTCDTFDPIYGNCLTCIQFYFLQKDGTCLQTLSSQKGAQAITNCPDGYYMRKDTCVQINPLCGKFNIDTGVCTSCVNTNYFLKSNGACILISDFCGYRTYFSNGQCLPVSPLCDTYDSTTGYCITCRDNTQLTDKGTCIFNQVCGDRQYHLADGSCQNISVNCKDFDKQTGDCLVCNNNYQLNSGYCCLTLNYYIDQTCWKFFKLNCRTQHPTFSYCTKCQVGHSQATPFSRCNPVAPNNSY